jgi:hypothetical protein
VRTRSRLAAALVGLVASGLAAPPASATVLLPTDNPLLGSMFQGADGNQDDAPPLRDWQALEALGVVHHSPDPSVEDSAFRAGSKEDEPGRWDLTTESGGSTRAKPIFSMRGPPSASRRKHVPVSRFHARG